MRCDLCGMPVMQTEVGIWIHVGMDGKPMGPIIDHKAAVPDDGYDQGQRDMLQRVALCEVAGEAICPLARMAPRTALERRVSGERKRHAEEAGSAPSDLAILAFDPGGTTGWAVLVIRPEALTDPNVKILTSVMLYTYGQIGEGGIRSGAAENSTRLGGEYRAEHEQVSAIGEMIDSWPHAAVVREDFILRTSNKSRDTLSPVRIGFGIDHLLWVRGRCSFTQQPAMAKSTASDERLKAWGLYRSGHEHARDATRHAIVFARRLKATPSLLAEAFPALVGVE